MSISIPHPPIQWVQLTYTSADSVSGGKGGWGVKEVSSGASDVVSATLVNGAQTRVDEVEETTPFASDDTIRSRVRVLTHRVRDGSATTLWHTVPASRDGTGRPGNVFCHAAQRLSGGAPGFRPIEMWRSPGWLVPFGAAEVNAAELTVLAPGSVVTRDGVIDFLQDPQHDRRYSLEWMVAAFAHTVSSTSAGGTRAVLVLVTETADEAAMWIGALSYVLPVPVAKAMEFTTFIRGRDLLDGAADGLDVVAVPRADVGLLQQSLSPSYVVCDPLWELDEPEDGSWRTPWGQRFPADQGWQDAVLDLLALDTAHGVRVLNEADALSLDLSDDRLLQLPLGWTLAFALLADPDSRSVDRERLLAEAVAEVPELLDTPRGRRMAGRTSIDGTEPSSELPAPAGVLTTPRSASRPTPGRESALFQQIRIYLQGGWREGPAPDGPASAEVVEDVRLQLADDMRTAMESSARELDPVDFRSVRRVAELLSYLYDHWLEELVDGDHADAANRLHELVYAILDGATGPGHDSWRAGLSPMLRGAEAAPARGPFSPPPTPVTPASVTGAYRSLDGRARAVPAPVPSYVVPALLCVTESSLDAVARELRMARPGDAVAGQVGEAVLTLTGGALSERSVLSDNGATEIAAAHWLAAHPPWTLMDEGRHVLAEWAGKLRGRRLPPALRASMDGWRAAHHVMDQAAPAASFARETPGDVLSNSRESFLECVEGVAGLLLEAPLDLAADVLVLIARRAGLDRQESVLDIVEPGGTRDLGTSAVMTALQHDPVALGDVREAVEGQLPTASIPPIASLFDSLTRTSPVPGQSFFRGR